MKNLTIIISLIALVPLTSCNFDLNLNRINGNGTVVTEQRTIGEDFNAVRGSSGLDVVITKGDENKILVEADENLHEVIETEVVNGTLKIGVKGNIGNSEKKTVYVTYVSINTVEASSGADVVVNSLMEVENLTLDSSSGASITAEVFSKSLYAEASSGADLKITGRSASLKAKASSGADIDARELLALNCNADVSSGADIKVNVKNTLEVEATSGGDIHYYGSPAITTENQRHLGSVHKM